MLTWSKTRTYTIYASLFIFCLLFIFILFYPFQNDQTLFSKLYHALNKWQAEQIKTRYHSGSFPKDNVFKWEKEVLKYKKEIELNIIATDNLGRVYKQLGLYYAHVGSYKQCTRSLESALSYGAFSIRIYYTLGLCYGHIANQNNWDYTYVKKAEKAFLKVLHNDPTFHKAKLKLGMLYFYGLSRNNQYQILNDHVTVTQKNYRLHALKLVLEYQTYFPEDKDAYFILANIFQANGDRTQARLQLLNLFNKLKKAYPNNYKTQKVYQQVKANLDQLSQE